MNYNERQGRRLPHEPRLEFSVQNGQSETVSLSQGLKNYEVEENTLNILNEMIG